MHVEVAPYHFDHCQMFHLFIHKKAAPIIGAASLNYPLNSAPACSASAFNTLL